MDKMALKVCVKNIFKKYNNKIINFFKNILLKMIDSKIFQK